MNSLAKRIDASSFEAFDVRHIQEKHPLAEKYIAVRLGRANIQRRQYPHYREKHKAKLAENLDAIDAMLEETDGTVASSTTGASSTQVKVFDSGRRC